MFPTPLFYTGRPLTRRLLSPPGKIASPARSLMWNLNFRTDPLLISTWKKGSCWIKSKMLLSLTPTNPSLKNRLTETMRGIQSYMGWNHIPDMDNSATTSDDNPFAGPKTQTPGKVSVQMPTEVEGYASQRKLVACFKISSYDQPSPQPSGTAYILTTRVTPLLCRLGTLIPLASTAATAGLPDRPESPLPHRPLVKSARRLCKNGENLQEKLLSFATKLPASTDAFSSNSKGCKR